MKDNEKTRNEKQGLTKIKKERKKERKKWKEKGSKNK